MTISHVDFGAGGRVLIAIPLLGFGLFSAVISFSGSPGMLRTLIVALGVWMVVVAHLLLLTDRLGHYLAIPTYAWFALNIIVGVLVGNTSKAALIWAAICVVAMLYSVITLWRKRRAHAI